MPKTDTSEKGLESLIVSVLTGQPGRTLTGEDIAHYQRVVVALKGTMRLMEEIDEVIEAHVGWPIA